MKSTIVFGPQGCGKSANAVKIAKALGLNSILDLDGYKGPRGIPDEGFLVLTQRARPEDFPGCNVVSFTDVMVGVGAAQ